MHVSGSNLRPDFDRSSIRHQFPDLVHLVVRYRNTSVGPIPSSMSGAKPSETVWESVDHDVTADGDSML